MEITPSATGFAVAVSLKGHNTALPVLPRLKAEFAAIFLNS